MEKRAVKKAIVAAQPFVAPGEHVVHVCRVRTKPPDHSRKVQNTAVAVAGVAVGAVLGGTFMVFSVPRTYTMLLTDRQLVFLETDPKTAATRSSLVATLPRRQISARRVRGSLSGRIVLDDAAGHEVVTLLFPLGVRLDGTNFLKAMADPAVR